MKLTREQTRVVIELLEERGIYYSPLKEELTDDISTQVEQLMSKQIPFQSALDSVMKSVDTSHLKNIQDKVLRTVFFNKRISRFEQKMALYLALALILWVVVEYLVGKFTGILELGALYGSLSMVLIATILVRSIRHIRHNIQGGTTAFYSIMWSGTKISLVSSLIFALFLTFFWTFINPTFYSEFQGEIDPNLTFSELVYRNVLGTCIGSFTIGLITTVLIGSFSRTSQG